MYSEITWIQERFSSRERPSQRGERIGDVYSSSNLKLNGQIARRQRNKTHSPHIPGSGLFFFF
jgi:hypothetical protein